MNSVTTTYLEMSDRAKLRPRVSTDDRFRVLEATVRQWRLNRFLYELVGEPWAWQDKLAWSDARWEAYVECERLRTFVACYDGSLAGYFELLMQERDVEIGYFGLTVEFIGKGFGGPLLSRAIEESWSMGARRVWVHTCSLDHPSALANYRARGMVVYKQEIRAATGPQPSSASKNERMA